jgi:hypothetical protein
MAEEAAIIGTATTLENSCFGGAVLLLNNTCSNTGRGTNIIVPP